MKRKLLLIAGLALAGVAGAQESPLWMRHCAISPDGSTVAFCYKGDIYTVSAQGGRATQLTTNAAYDTRPVWSPDGTRLAFASSREGSLDVYVISKDGGTPKRITTHSGNETPVAFSDDGHVLYEASLMPDAQDMTFPSSQFPQVYQVSSEGGRPVLYSSIPMEDISVGSDGTTLLYHDKKGYEDPWRKHHTSSITRDIWMSRMADGKRTYTKLTDFAGEDRTPVGSADGKSFYYLSEKDGTFNVYRRNVDGTGEVQLTRYTKHPVRFLTAARNGLLCYGYDGEIYTLKEGAQPQKLAVRIVTDQTERTSEPQVKTSGATEIAVSPDGKEIAFILHGDVFVTSSDYKTTRKITDTPEQERDLDFSPDGRKILYNTYTENTTGRPLTLMSVYEVDMQDFSTDTIFTEEPFINDVNYSPDGRQLLIMGTPSAFDGIGLNCGEHKIANDYDIQAFIMDMDSKDILPISKDFAPSLNFLQWNKADGCIYFNTDDENCRNIYKYDPKKDSFEKLPLEKDVITRFDIADFNPAVAAYTGMDNSSAGAAYLYNAKSKKSEIIEDPMRETIDAIEWGTTEEWNFTASDGTVIKGEMCLPPSFDPAKKYPLIVYYYGGTTPTVKGITSPYCSQLFASRDYVVYTIQPSGAIGFGQEFSARHVNAWGKRTADDIIEGTKQFCEEHPFIDKERIGCIGASYGGFMTQYLQTQTDIFAAAVSHAGISNVTSYWGEGYWGYSYNSIAAADSYPWTDPNLFTKQGSLFNADKINTPLLLLHGTADTNVPIGESIQLFNALKILGKTVELITVDGEDHFISDYDKRCLWHNTIMAWFARWLQDSPQWWESIYPEKEI